MLPFEIIEHTADVGILAHGTTLEELFANAAAGMFSIIRDRESVLPREHRSVHLHADALPALLAEFLDELLYRFDAEHFVLRDAEVHAVSTNEIRATLHGESLAPHHRLHTEIKAVTHHRLTVQPDADAWRATVLFDI